MNDEPTNVPPPSGPDDDLIARARLQAEGVSPADGGVALLPGMPPADSFPGYELIREIHRGGQGAVYLALQKNTKRKVAIKVMHGGPHIGSAGRSRFEREVQILGQLDHPNIVRIMDSGTTPDGGFYYVMDYISGRTLDAHVAAVKPPIQEVLRLFAKICDGVNAAHLKGVIHRDLKPANVRVDARGEPVIVDFGLAKIAVPDLTPEARLMSVTGQFIGSLPWASPEQAGGSPAAIDVRTDVYSLGVMLYQVLTGRFPYDVVGNMRDVLDNILRATPARPSTVRRQINDEVETIVLKCLSKERERRYQNAGEVARDITHYLRGEPIEAKRDSGWYVISKTLRRYRTRVAVIGAFAVLVIAAGVTIAVLTQRAREATLKAAASSAEARAAESDRAAAVARAGEEAARAETARRVTERVLGFLRAVFEAARPSGDRRQVLAEDVLDAAANLAQRELADQPEVAVEVYKTMGDTYVQLRALAKARPHLQRAAELRAERLGADHLDTLSALNSLGVCYRNLQEFDKAEEVFRRVIAGLSARADRGPKHAHTIAVRFNLARALDAQRDDAKRTEAAETYRSLAADLRGVEKQEGLLATVLVSLADVLLTLHRPADAAAPLDEALSLGATHAEAVPPQTRARARISRARLLDAQGASFDEVDAAFREGVEAYREVMRKDDNPEVLVARSRRADFLKNRGRPGDAAAEYRAIVEALQAAADRGDIDREDPLIRQMQWPWGEALMAAGRLEDAAPILRAAHDMFMKKKPDGDGAAETRRLLFDLYTRLGRPEEAARYAPK